MRIIGLGPHGCAAYYLWNNVQKHGQIFGYYVGRKIALPAKSDAEKGAHEAGAAIF